MKCPRCKTEDLIYAQDVSYYQGFAGVEDDGEPIPEGEPDTGEAWNERVFCPGCGPLHVERSDAGGWLLHYDAGGRFDITSGDAD